jgi:hypothetical protein
MWRQFGGSGSRPDGRSARVRRVLDRGPEVDVVGDRERQQQLDLVERDRAGSASTPRQQPRDARRASPPTLRARRHERVQRGLREDAVRVVDQAASDARRARSSTRPRSARRRAALAGAARRKIPYGRLARPKPAASWRGMVPRRAAGRSGRPHGYRAGW